VPDSCSEPDQPQPSEAKAEAQDAAQAPGDGWWQRRRRLAAGIGAAAAVALVAFGMFAAVGGLSGSASASSVIPSPPSKNKQFVADEDGTGADNQANILASVAPGLVHVLSASGQAAGVGVILTPSGLVLTSARVAGSADHLTVRTVLSGRSFAAQVLGRSAADDLALIQLDGVSTPLRPIAVGNSQDFAVGAAVTVLGSAGVTKTIALDLGNLASQVGAVTVADQQLTGLLESSLQVPPEQETGGPVVNLSGQVVGINVGGAGSGLHAKGFAVPINRALTVARQLQSRAKP
jgi:S1-C subfamily serine protease